MASQQPVLTVINEDLTQGAEDVPILFRISSPEQRADGRESVPTDIVCVIDISGSMGTLATIQSASGVVESNGLTLLDVAKHGVRTVIASLGDTDRLAVVAFDDQQDIVVPLTKMDEEGKTLANKKVEALDDRGGTDIWGGLFEGLEILRNAPKDSSVPREAHVILLTDGQTMRRDACMPNARQYLQKYEGLPGTISTMGFGYNIDSPLLDELSKFGSGMYSFIPDAGFVGTVFVNTMSNLLVTMAADVTLVIAEEGASVLQACGGIESEKKDNVWRLKVGLLQYGQSADIVVRANVPAGGKLEANLAYRALNDAGAIAVQQSECVELQAAAASPSDIQLLYRHVQRCDYVDSVQLAVDTVKSEGVERSAGIVRDLAERIEKSQAASDEHVQKLLSDIQGQMLEAFSKKEYWNKWGCHYVPAAVCAHRLEVCNNFKDPGVQVYGGSMFAAIQDKADTLYNELPPPTSADRQFSEGYDAAAPISMAHYNDRNCA
mmetsp:Transcript_26657/g.61315  ORF Transcript_26657/g.61315 Transcript_26657/m.61315 type:complete len:493 (+) Transcript_26657:75-1553(+)